MGNEPSIASLPESWHSTLPHITRETILQHSYRYRHHRGRRVLGGSSSIRSYSNCTTNSSIDDQGVDVVSTDDAMDHKQQLQKSVYLDDDLFDLDEHIPTALAILTAYPHLKDIRFKLVPGVMKEEQFWECVFGILNEREDVNVIDFTGDKDGEKKVVSSANDYEVSKEELIMTVPAHETRYMSDTLNHAGGIERTYYDGASKSNTSSNGAPSFYLDEIKKQHERIQQLEQVLREARHQARKLALDLHKERAKLSRVNTGREKVDDVVSACPRCNDSTIFIPENAVVAKHKGQWIMHPDCMEFMKLDDHLKQNLRSEKQKRINEVLSQMKFILDTDEIKDSYGKWSCCDSPEYSSRGCNVYS